MSQWLYFIMKVNGQNQITNPAILVKNLIASPLTEENMSSKYPPNKVIVNMISINAIEWQTPLSILNKTTDQCHFYHRLLYLSIPKESG